MGGNGVCLLQRLEEFVGQQQYGVRQVEGGIKDGGGEANEVVTVDQLFPPKAILFSAEDEGDPVMESQGGDLGNEFPGSGDDFPSSSRSMGGANHKMSIGNGTGKIGIDQAGIQNFSGSMCQPASTLSIPFFGGIDQHQLRNARVFKNPGGGANIARIGRFDEDDSKVC